MLQTSVATSTGMSSFKRLDSHALGCDILVDFEAERTTHAAAVGRSRIDEVGEAIISASNPFGFQINNTQVSFQVKVIPELIKVDKIDIVNTTPVGEDGKIY